MDALRDDDDREINNHGNPIPVNDSKENMLAKSDTKVIHLLSICHLLHKFLPDGPNRGIWQD